MTSLPGAVTIHKFTAGRFDKERLADEIAAVAGDVASTLPGLRRAIVLREYGGSHIAIVAEWEDHEALAAGTGALYADPRLHELAAETGESTNEAYTPVSSVEGQPAGD